MFAMAAYILGVMFCMGLILGAIALAIRFWYLTLGLIALAVMLVAGSISKAQADITVVHLTACASFYV